MKKLTILLLLVFSVNVVASVKLGDTCDTHAGMSDSYVLALSSQPGFCQTYGYEAGKPECMHLPKNSYQAKHLTLHGLWPNQSACGQSYGYCGVEQKSNHCAYPPLNLSSQVAEQLKKLCPVIIMEVVWNAMNGINTAVVKFCLRMNIFHWPCV